MTQIKDYTFSLDGNDNFHIQITTTGQQIKVDTEFLTVDNSGLKVWPIGEEFCKYISSHRHLFANKKVVELGSGTGLCGLFVSRLCEHVVLTDGDDEVMDVLRQNRQLNTNFDNVSVQKLRWGDEQSMTEFSEKFQNFQVVIGCEIIYADPHVSLVFSTAKSILKQTGGVFVLVYVSRLRHLTSQIFSTAEQLGFKTIPVTDYTLTNDPLSANHSFRMLLMFELPPAMENSLENSSGSTQVKGSVGVTEAQVQSFEQLFDLTETYVDNSSDQE